MAPRLPGSAAWGASRRRPLLRVGTARYIAQASVFDPPAAIKAPNPIWDARLLDLRPERLVICGFELVKDDGGTVRDYAQS
ncbi:MAG: hypothetical protein EON56_02385 [Alphaproteobacteria bacterium]|nr:MAG: hypothetical protein EON56_02385 [Alphaproteobacteria bacterium]